MKAKITLFAVLALAMGCTKMAPPGGDAMVVTFQVGGIRTGEYRNISKKAERTPGQVKALGNKY